MDGRTDLYGLGILLFHLATGKMPFDSRDPGEVLRWHLDGPPIDTSPIRTRTLARLVQRMTCRDPEQRPASAAEALFLLGGPRVRARRTRRDPDDDRTEPTALRLALDSARLGARRVHRARSFERPACSRRFTVRCSCTCGPGRAGRRRTSTAWCCECWSIAARRLGRSSRNTVFTADSPWRCSAVCRCGTACGLPASSTPRIGGR